MCEIYRYVVQASRYGIRRPGKGIYDTLPREPFFAVSSH